MAGLGRAEAAISLDGLRAAIAGIEAGGVAARAQDGQVRAGPTRARLGAARLDALLGGGLAHGVLHEVVAASAPDRPAAAGFTLAVALRLARQSGGRGWIAWIAADFALLENGGLYGPGLAALGLDPARLLLIAAPRAREALWAMEEALKCRALAAAVVELSDPRACDLTAARRLALAARASGTTGLLLHPRLPPVSAAATRFEIAAGRSVAAPSYAASRPPRMPLPGPPAFMLRLLRARAAPAHDPDRRFSLAWDCQGGIFRDLDRPLPHPGGIPADSRDGSNLSVEESLTKQGALNDNIRRIA